MLSVINNYKHNHQWLFWMVAVRDPTSTLYPNQSPLFWYKLEIKHSNHKSYDPRITHKSHLNYTNRDFFLINYLLDASWMKKPNIFLSVKCVFLKLYGTFTCSWSQNKEFSTSMQCEKLNLNALPTTQQLKNKTLFFYCFTNYICLDSQNNYCTNETFKKFNTQTRNNYRIENNWV